MRKRVAAQWQGRLLRLRRQLGLVHWGGRRRQRARLEGDPHHHLGDGGSLGQRLRTQRTQEFQKDVSKRLSSQPGVPSYVMGFTDVSSFGGAAVSSPSTRR